MELMPWQVTRKPSVAPTNPGKRMQPVYKVDRDKITGECKLVIKEYYDIQELTDSYGEEANPVTLMQRVRLGEMHPWNGEDTIDASQLPQELHQVPEYVGTQVEELTRIRTNQLEKYFKERRTEHEREKLGKEIKVTEPADK